MALIELTKAKIETEVMSRFDKHISRYAFSPFNNAEKTLREVM